MKLRHVVVLAYNSSDDPLVQGGFLLVLLHVARQQPDLRLHLITYEQEDYPLTLAQQQRQAADWAAAGIIWHPLTWHSGRYKILKKVYDLLVGLLLCMRLRWQIGVRSLIGFGTVAGSFGFMISKILGMRYYFYQFEPHSEFMRDCGVWPESSLAFRALNYMEGISGKYADFLSTGTTHMIARLQKEGSHAKTYLLPSCVDDDRFQFTAVGRQVVRVRYGLTADQPVVLYLGKFGGIYYEQETADMCAALLRELPDLHFLVVTPDPPAYVASLMRRAGLPENRVTITRSPFKEVQSYISAADFGLVAVPPTPAQQYRSPIKVGEYLCCGLPYLTCWGISEDDKVAEQYNVGVVVSGFSEAEATRVAPRIAAFIAEDDETLRQRCRQAGVNYRSLRHYLPVAEEICAQL